jgi:MFS family permease
LLSHPGPLRSVGRNVWLLLANTILAHGSLAVVGLALNLYLAQVAYREDFIGLVSFVSVLAVAACAVPAGYLSNRVGPRACIIGAGVLMSASFAVIASTSNASVILAGGVASGVGQALLFVPTVPFLMDSTDPGDRLRVWSMSFAAMAVGAVLGSAGAGYMPGLLGAVAGVGFDPVLPLRLTLLVGAIVVLASVVPMLFARRGSQSASSAGSHPESQQPTDPRAVRRYIVRSSISVIFIAVGTGVVFPFFNVYFVEQLDMTVSEVGVVFALGSALMVPGTLLGPAVGRRVGVVRGIAISRAITVPLFVVSALVPSVPVGVSTYVVRSGFMSATWPLDNAFVMELVGARSRALLAGTRSASWNLGWSISSLIAGQAIVLTGYWIVFVASAAFTLAGLVYHYVAFIGEERRATTSR